MDSTAKFFVTGGTGFIGTRLVHALTGQGRPVRVLSRRTDIEPPPGFEGDGNPLRHDLVELLRGDVTDRESLADGMQGCSHVFHLAGYAKNWARDPKTYFDVNVQGTRNVLDAAEQAGVERIVVTSTIMTLGPSPRGVVGDEEAPWISQRYLTDYEETKAVAEREAVERAAHGCPVVIVNPTRVYGPGHLTEGNSLALLIDQYDRGLVPVLLNAGVNVGNYVLVDDVVAGHLAAMRQGRIGQRYILGGENASLKEFFRTVDRVSGKRHFQVPLWKIAPLAFAWLLKKRAQWLGTYPRITPGWMKTFLSEWAYSSDKARRELDYDPVPLAEGVKITYEWLMRVRDRK